MNFAFNEKPLACVVTSFIQFSDILCNLLFFIPFNHTYFSHQKGINIWNGIFNWLTWHGNISTSHTQTSQVLICQSNTISVQFCFITMIFDHNCSPFDTADAKDNKFSLDWLGTSQIAVCNKLFHHPLVSSKHLFWPWLLPLLTHWSLNKYQWDHFWCNWRLQSLQLRFLK